MTPTAFADVAATAAAVAAVSGRSAKRDAMADLLRRVDPDEVEVVVGFLVGEPRQGRMGVGWRTLAAAEAPPALTSSLTVAQVDGVLTELAGLSGAGSAGRRRALLGDLLGRATEDEAHLFARLLGGEMRQGALAGVVTDAVATAAGVPATVVRRALMLGGDLGIVARIALTEGRSGLEEVGLEVGRPLQPMLASTAASVADAVADLGRASVEWKLDGIRLQVHRRAGEVRLWTRNLNEVTARMPEIVARVAALPGGDLVADGEVLVVDGAGRPVAFQDTASRVSTDSTRTTEVRPFLFDLLHLDGRDLIDEALTERRRALAEVAGDLVVPGVVTTDPDAGEAVLADALAAGHEGVVVKGAASRYEAGRRGKAWRKVKPVHTFDLVVLAAEWGHGRRTGWLSNLHLGARVDGPGDRDGLVMVGKTFKGMTDELLRWQTDALLPLAISTEEWAGPRTGVVHVRPELVVEIALDGVQRSTRYSGGIALRFARVVRYREDKSPDQADTLESLKSLGVSASSEDE